jgi:hypothetical protein
MPNGRRWLDTECKPYPRLSLLQKTWKRKWFLARILRCTQSSINIEVVLQVAFDRRRLTRTCTSKEGTCDGAPMTLVYSSTGICRFGCLTVFFGGRYYFRVCRER